MEIEAKYQIPNKIELDTLIEKLKIKHIDFSESVNQKDVYYKESGFRNKVNGPGSYIIRLRYVVEDHCLLTLKKLTNIDGVWYEVETIVEDGSKIEEILIQIGLEKAVTVEKNRRKAVYKNLEIIIDDVLGLGIYLEVSVIESHSIKHSKQLILDMFNEIEIDLSKIELRGYPTILLEKQGVNFSVK